MQSGEYWIGFGDIHDDISRIHAIPGIRQAAGVILSGDLTVGGSVKQAERVLRAVAEVNQTVYAQIGNMDRAEVTTYLEENGWNIHIRSREIAPGVGLMGVGTSTFTPFGTPSEFPDSRIAEWLEQAYRDARHFRRLILISHTPPFNTECDRISSGVHVGSRAVREFIEEHQPDICLCGHIHESRATGKLGRTTLINTGTLSAGGYAVIRNMAEGLQAELHMLA
ncbi:metallophosphoesterase [Desulfovibrio psychrotolerans]|uniref:Serine/threonine protein phosphatase n=1 Tax=Desulfovibrio psychrotolerans TaxID=415242 RepID=A0A7J0BXR1_9BACT|nr:metallophosphoesterase [Desulfovibrio psychrotolerans]GFM38487.1 serine/threonine protein phosphatase [Desulfovibrio psychrotolerans]